MESWIYVLLSLGSIALITGAVLGYLFGVRAGGRRERFVQMKEKLKRNKAAVFKQQKERYEYLRQIQQLESEMLQLTSESELYKERMADLDFYQQKLRESERIIAVLSDENKEFSESASLSLLVQMKEDPLHANLTRTEWNEVFVLTDMLFNRVLTVLKEKYAITRHEQEICCLVKWNFSRKEQLAVV